jgi:hypothetical protein
MYGHRETCYCLWTTGVWDPRIRANLHLLLITYDERECRIVAIYGCVMVCWVEGGNSFNTKTASNGTSVNWTAHVDAECIKRYTVSTSNSWNKWRSSVLQPVACSAPRLGTWNVCVATFGENTGQFCRHASSVPPTLSAVAVSPSSTDVVLNFSRVRDMRCQIKTGQAIYV